MKNDFDWTVLDNVIDSDKMKENSGSEKSVTIFESK